MTLRLLVPGLSLALLLGCAGRGGEKVAGTAGSNGAGQAGTTGAAGTTGVGNASGTSGGGNASGSAGVTGMGGDGNASGGGGTGLATGSAGTTGAAGISGAAGDTGASGTTGAAGSTSTGSAGSGSASMDGGTDAVCQMAQYKFEPKLPTVYLMVDRSGSMFDCLSQSGVQNSCPTLTDTAWDKLRLAVEMVVSPLQDQVRFGFAAFMGLAGKTCPMLSKVAPKVNNLAAIKAVYDALPPQPETNSPGMKFESPASQTLAQLGAELMADTAPGDKYVLFVTDGQPDYCDDSNQLCAPDSVIAGIQQLKAKGITTIVIGLQTTSYNLAAGILESYANAGAGEPTKVPGDPVQIFDQCNSIAPWRADFLAVAPDCATDLNACRGRTVGTYSATAGPTKPYKPDASNQAMLVSQLSTAIAGVKSCTFDLGDIGGKSIKVDTAKLDQAKVLVEGKAVPLSDTNGWKMNGQTQLELVGSACTNWRKPENDDIDFQFPCSTIIFE